MAMMPSGVFPRLVRPYRLTVMCSKPSDSVAPRRRAEEVHSRFRQFVNEADAGLAEQLQSRRTAEGHWADAPLRSSSPARRKEEEVEALSLLMARLWQVQRGGEVAGLLRSAQAQGVAGPKFVTAALDRLRMLHQQTQGRTLRAGPGSLSACRLAVYMALRLPEASPWLLVALVRTAFSLRYKVPPRQQYLVTERFLGMAGREDMTEQSLTNFIWATFSNFDWELSAAQRRALMDCVRARATGAECGGREGEVDWEKEWEVVEGQEEAQQAQQAQHAAQQACEPVAPHFGMVLIGLVRLQTFAGREAVVPFLEDGTVGAMVDKLVLRLGSASAIDCQDCLLSAGRLALDLDPRTVEALLQQLLAVTGQVAGDSDRLAKAFVGLSFLCRATPERYRGLLAGPTVAALCSLFLRLSAAGSGRRGGGGAGAQRRRQRRHPDDWPRMLQACASMRCNPEVGAAGEPLFEVFLSQLPLRMPQLGPYGSADALLGFAAMYGGPGEGGRLPEALQPYQYELASLAAKAQGSITEELVRKRGMPWPAGEINSTIDAFAELGRGGGAAARQAAAPA